MTAETMGWIMLGVNIGILIGGFAALAALKWRDR